MKQSEYLYQIKIQLYTTIISMQANQHTYSLQAILDSDRLDPDLCRLMLHEIKSPLLEHSFQMTADDDRTENNFGSFSHDNTPKKFPAERNEHNHLDSFSMTNSIYENSRKIDHLQDKKRTNVAERKNSNNNHNLHDKFAQSIVSPLDHYKFLSGNNLQEEDFHIFFQSEASQPKKQKIANWCGGIFNPNLDQYSNQINVDPKDHQYLRRKIFKKKQAQGSPEPHIKTARPRLLNFTQCTQRLTKIQQPQLANFILFISKCLPLLSKLEPYCKNLDNNSALLYQILLQNNPVNYETKQCYQNKNRITNRLQVYRISEMLEKLRKNKNPQSSSQQRKYIENDIETIFKYLNQVQDIVENYVSRKQAVGELKIVHGLLYPNTIKNKKDKMPGSPIQSLKISNNEKRQNNYTPVDLTQNAQSLKIRLLRLFGSLKIDQYYYEKLEQLKYIWPELQQPRSYQHSDQFIRQMCKNDILVLSSASQQKPIFTDKIIEDQVRLIKKLQMEGFTRNA